MEQGNSQFHLDPETVKLIVELLAPLAEELIAAIVANTSKLDELLKKVDQLYLREIRGGFEALEDGLSSHNAETRRVRLEFAERALLNNVQLGPGFTGGTSNEYLMAQCHYGLSIIAARREDSDVAARHVLRSFVVDAGSSRLKFFPTIFAQVMHSHCDDVYKWNSEELARINREQFQSKVLLHKAKYGALAAGSAGIALFAVFSKGSGRSSLMHGGVQGMKSAGKAFNEVGPEQFQADARVQQSMALERRLNERCRALAKAALEKIVS